MPNECTFDFLNRIGALGFEIGNKRKRGDFSAGALERSMSQPDSRDTHIMEMARIELIVLNIDSTPTP